MSLTHIVKFRTTEEEYAKYERQAAKLGWTVSAWIRFTLNPPPYLKENKKP